jgi:phosphoglycerate dehydrogenase-like enzyme
MPSHRPSTILVVFGSLMVAACGRGGTADGDDPMAALAAESPSTRYQADFWSAERRQRSSLWQQAAAYCTPERARTKPNCQAVLTNVAAEQGNARADSALRAAGQGAAGARRSSDLEFRP